MHVLQRCGSKARLVRLASQRIGKRRSAMLAALAGLAAVVPQGGRAAAAPLLVGVLPDDVAGGRAVLAGRPDADAVLPVAVALPLRDPAGLATLLQHLTDPHDTAFRHWLSVAEFARRFSPSVADAERARAALAAGGLTLAAASPSRLVIEARGRVADLERLLHVRFGLYRHPTEARLFLSPDREPSADLGTPVLGIEGLENFQRPVSRLVQAAVTGQPTGSGPHGQFTGQDVRLAYYGHGPLTGAGQSVGLFEFGGYDPNDVAAYDSAVHAIRSVPVVTVALDGVAAVCTAVCHDAEQALDIEEAGAMAPGLDSIVYYTGRNPISILGRMASDDLCATLSVSYGWKPNPKLDEPVLQEMAAQGQTLLVATGDYGFHLTLGAVWPSDDAWSIAVGGTDLVTAGPGGPRRVETGWRYSGGGPSPDGIAIPAWQSGFVTVATGGSTRHRNVPDIAGDADTDNFSCYNGKCSGGNGGTSYAAPLWAGFVALANQQAALAGRPAVGFFAPSLYASASPSKPPVVVLHDEVAGYNGKYRAQSGFDLVTGLGSPFGALTIERLIYPQ